MLLFLVILDHVRSKNAGPQTVLSAVVVECAPLVPIRRPEARYTGHFTVNKIAWMANSRFNVAGLSIALLAIPVWILVGIEVPLRSDRPDRQVIAPIVLCGMTVAVHVLLRLYKNSWPLSALIAGCLSLAVLLWSAG